MVISLVILTLSGVASAQSERISENWSKPVFTLQTPQAGDKITSGSVITIRWTLALDSAIVQNPWSEMELYLVDDGGLFMRITPQLDVTTKTFQWTVPNVNTKSAKLVLKCGIEGEGEMYDLSHAGTFSIKGRRGANVTVNSLTKNTKSGENMEISWVPEMMDAARMFDVMISYDRGAHFHKAGSTTESRFSLPVEADFSGSITVKIVGFALDGSRVESVLTPDVTTRVRGAGEKDR